MSDELKLEPYIVNGVDWSGERFIGSMGPSAAPVRDYSYADSLESMSPEEKADYIARWRKKDPDFDFDKHVAEVRTDEEERRNDPEGYERKQNEIIRELNRRDGIETHFDYDD